VLVGSPGSGKGTQARLLSQCLQIPHISTGDMLRERIRAGDGLGKAVVEAMHSGSLVPNGVVNLMVEDRLKKPDCRRGFILDGYPRTGLQAEHLCKWFNDRDIREVVIHLVVDYNIVIARLTGRRQCPQCGSLYNLVSKPPREDELCDRDGSKLVIRDDDRELVIRERLESYERQTMPLIEHFRKKGRRLVEVDASNDPPDRVFQNIRHAVENE